MKLDFSPEILEKLFDRASKMIIALFEGLRERRVFPDKSPAQIRALFDEPLPIDGSDPEEILGKIEDDVIANCTFNISPHYRAYYTGSASQVSIVADMLAAALNQNLLKYNSSPSATEMERVVIRWISEFIGYFPSAAGVLISGGTQANLHCLAVMRKIKSDPAMSLDGLYGSQRMTVYVSSEAHSSIEKAMDILGLGKNHLRKIPVNNEFTIDLDILEDKIEDDIKAGFRPIGLVGMAGTTNTGAVDPLDRLADIARKYNLWYHIDAAYGGPVAGIDSFKDLFCGMERADSVVVDPHKWMYIPFEAGCVLVKEPKHLRDTFSLLPDYLRFDVDRTDRFDFMEYSIDLTRNFRALKIWMTLKVYGANKIRAMIEEDIKKAHYLAELIDKSDRFERLAPALLSVVNFRYIPPRIGKPVDEAHIDRLNGLILSMVEQDGRVFLTGTKIAGRTSLRAACINHRTTKRDMEYLLNVLSEIGEAADNSLKGE